PTRVLWVRSPIPQRWLVASVFLAARPRFVSGVGEVGRVDQCLEIFVHGCVLGLSRAEQIGTFPHRSGAFPHFWLAGFVKPRIPGEVVRARMGLAPARTTSDPMVGP